MIDYSKPRFKTSEVARAAGLGASALRNYFARGHFPPLHLDRRAPDGDGLPTLFSLRDALLVGVAADMIAAGVAPDRSFRAATVFAHTGTEDRMPASLFTEGRTLLVYRPKSDLARIINSGTSLDLAEASAPVSSDNRDPLIIVDAGATHDIVLATLNV